MLFPDDPEAWQFMDEITAPLRETPVVIWKNSQPCEGDPEYVAAQRGFIANHLGLATRWAQWAGVGAIVTGLAAVSNEWAGLTAVAAPATLALAVLAVKNYVQAAYGSYDLALDPTAVTWRVEPPVEY